MTLAGWKKGAVKMKDTPRANDVSERLSYGIILYLTHVNTPLCWEQKTCVEEGLKKPLDMYIGTRGFKGCVDETMLMERLMV